MVDRKELRKRLPRGYVKEVAKLAKVTTCAVSYYFSYKINSHVIERAVLDIVVKLEKEREELLSQIK